MEEKRLIDADKIYDAIERRYQVSSGIEHRCERDFLDLICASDTVDAVEVVRCRDCAKDGLFTCPICFIENKTLHFINHSPDFYCGEGERKDDDGNG